MTAAERTERAATDPAVHCHSCGAHLAYDAKLGALVHPIQPDPPHLADPRPRELRAWRSARKGA